MSIKEISAKATFYFNGKRIALATVDSFMGEVEKQMNDEVTFKGTVIIDDKEYPVEFQGKLLAKHVPVAYNETFTVSVFRTVAFPATECVVYEASRQAAEDAKRLEAVNRDWLKKFVDDATNIFALPQPIIDDDVEDDRNDFIGLRSDRAFIDDVEIEFLGKSANDYTIKIDKNYVGYDWRNECTITDEASTLTKTQETMLAEWEEEATSVDWCFALSSLDEVSRVNVATPPTQASGSCTPQNPCPVCKKLAAAGKPTFAQTPAVSTNGVATQKKDESTEKACTCSTQKLMISGCKGGCK